MDDKISILLEVIGQQAAQITEAAKRIDDVTQANERAAKTVQRSQKIIDAQGRAYVLQTEAATALQVALAKSGKQQADNVRVIDSNTQATERATRAVQKQQQVIQRNARTNAGLASDPNAFFGAELDKEISAKAAAQADAARKSAEAQAIATQAAQDRALKQAKAAALTEAAESRALAAQQNVVRSQAAAETALLRKAAAQEKARKATEAGTKANNSALTAVSNLQRGVVAVTAAITAATLAVLPFFSAINREEEIGKLSKELGLSVETLSRWTFAANLQKISTEQLGLGLRGFNKAIVDSENKSSNAARAFAALGLDPKKFKTNEELLRATIDQFARYADSERKTAAAQFLFEESGAKLIPFFNLGTRGLDELAKKSDAYGQTVSPEQAAKAAAFNQRIIELQQAASGTAKQLADAFLPTLIKGAQFLIDNKDAVIAVVGALGTLVAIIATVAASMKAYTITMATAAAISKGFAIAQGAAATASTALAATAAAFGPYLVALAAVSAAIAIIVTGLEAWAAKQQEITSKNNLEAQQKALTEQVRARIALLKEEGKLTDEQVTRMEAVLRKTSAAGPESAQRGLTTVRNQLRAAEGLQTLTPGGQNAAKAQADAIAKAQAKALADAQAAQGREAFPAIPTSSQITDPDAAKRMAAELQRELLDTQAKAAQAEANIQAQKNAGTIAAEKNLEAEHLARVKANLFADQAAAAQEIVETEKRLQEINRLEGISEAEKNALIESARAVHHAKLDQMSKDSADRQIAEEKRVKDARIKLMELQLDASQKTFGGIADAIKEFGGEGTTAYKVFATAQAVIATALAAIQAYSSTVGIPYVGPILAPIAAGAAIAVGAAQIAKINGAFAEGGIVPGAPSNTDNRLAAVATGELIISAASTRALIGQVGMGGVRSLMGGMIPTEFAGGYVPRSASSHFATGGLIGPVDGGAAASRNLDITLADIRDRQAERDMLARDATTIIVDKLNRRGNRLKV